MTKLNRPKKILFFLNHPAHYHLFKHIINNLRTKGYTIVIVIVKKDVLEDLVKHEGWLYINLFPEGRRSQKFRGHLSTAIYFLKTLKRLIPLLIKNRVDLMVGTERTITHAGFLLHIPSLYINEDDTVATPENKITYPFATKVIMPECCDVGKWEGKKITYKGYHELAYLHPDYFKPDERMRDSLNLDGSRYFVIRLAELTASHDVGKRGISDSLLREIIAKLTKHGKVFISSERMLPAEFASYRLPTKPHDIFHVLYFADLYIGDSQTMAAEAAVLGTPSIRFNDFIGKLGYLHELEHLYELTFGISASHPERLLQKIDELLSMPHLKQRWENKRKIMLVESVNVVDFMTRTIESFVS